MATTITTAITLAPLLRQSVGFDRLSDLFESALHNEPCTCHPPYDIERYGDDHYRIVVAAAGLSADDLELRIEKSVLIVSGGERPTDAGATYLHQGIAHGAFRLVFHLADHIEIQGATFENGLLIIFLLRVVPDQPRARHIKINSPDEGPDRRKIDRP